MSKITMEKNMTKQDLIEWIQFAGLAISFLVI